MGQVFLFSLLPLFFLLLVGLVSGVSGYRRGSIGNRLPSSVAQEWGLRARTSNDALSAAAASLLSGAVAGSVGVGVSYPLDSIKTKSQVYAPGASPGLGAMFRLVYENEGLSGFYQGVTGVMLGQALIKAIAFAVNSFALTKMDATADPNILQLSMAGGLSGLVASFAVNPIERVKVLMQADQGGKYASELSCMYHIVRDDSVFGLMFRGLDATILREVRSII